MYFCVISEFNERNTHGLHACVVTDLLTGKKFRLRQLGRRPLYVRIGCGNVSLFLAPLGDAGGGPDQLTKLDVSVKCVDLNLNYSPEGRKN